MYRVEQSQAARKSSLDDLVTHKLLSQLKAAGVGHAQAGSPSSAAGSDHLVADLVRRVISLESDNMVLKQQLQQEQEQQQLVLCSQQHTALQDQLAGQQQITAAQCHQPECVKQQQQHQAELKQLRHQCKEAWTQVSDMKAFLQDYGLAWVGESMPAAAVDSQINCCTGPAESLGSNAVAAAANHDAVCLPFDIAELQVCVDELNQSANEDTEQQQINRLHLHKPASRSGSPVVKSAAQQQENVKLIIYSNGLQLYTAPARPYSDATVDAILIDIFDGYFPSVLKREFPDGTRIQLVDRSHISMAAAAAMAGNGSHSNLKDLDSVLHDETEFKPYLEKKSFLDRLPKALIKNGNVVPVRDAVDRYLVSSSSAVSAGNGDCSGTAAPAQGLRTNSSDSRVYIKRANSSGSRSRSSIDGSKLGSDLLSPKTEQPCSSNSTQQHHQQQARLATIQVKSEDGQQTYVMKLPYTATIGSVRASIAAHREFTSYSCKQCAQGLGAAAAVQCQYELRTAFPSKVYDVAGLSLEAAGLTPSATLLMRHC